MFVIAYIRRLIHGIFIISLSFPSVIASEEQCRAHYLEISAEHDNLLSTIPPGTDIFNIKMHELEGNLFEALKECREDPLLFTLMAENLVMTGNVPLAAIYAKRAHASNPDLWQTNHTHGKILSLQKKFVVAIPLLEKAVELQPDRPGLKYNLCQAYVDSENYQSAVESCTEIIDMEQTSYTGRAYLLRSKAHIGLNNDEQANLDKEQAKKLGIQ